VPLKNQKIFTQDVITGKVIKLKQEIAHKALRELDVLTIKKNLAFMNLITDKSKAIVTGSSKKNLEVFLNKSELIYDVIVNGEEVKSKPNPAGYTLAINRLNLSPSECIVFEDSEKGLQAALEAGASAVHIFGFWENKCTSHPSSEEVINFQCYKSLNDWFAKVYE
jgi:HAD superfamily hydrolase (TIGR01509 family)